MTQKTFVLGLGAPKSGTTWLYRYIASLPCSDMGLRKEYRVFPQLFQDMPLRSRFNFRRLVRRQGLLPMVDRGQFLRLRMITQPGHYERYFASLVDGRDTWLTGDISPGYMTLEANQLRDVAGRLRGAGFHVKVVFLMRDPVERVWSGARMRKRNGDAGFDGLSDADALRAIYGNHGVAARTRYDRTIESIEAAFDPADVFMALYEELFTPSEVDRLSAFLGVPSDHSMLGTRVNRTDKQGVLDPELAAEVRDFFAPVYDFCNARFPQTRELWN